MMSHQAAASDFGGLKKTLAFSVRLVAFITIPAMLGLMIWREPIIRVLFQHGAFIAESTRLTARALLYYAIALPGLATVKLVVPAFYSTKDTKTPVIVAAISMVLNVVLNIVFLEFSSSGCRTVARRWRPPLACYFDFFALILIFRLRYGPMGFREILKSFSKIFLCSAIMGVACWLGGHYTEFTIHSRFLGAALDVHFVDCRSYGVVPGAAWVFRCSESKRFMV